MRRFLLLSGLLVLISALGIFIPAVSAQCSPDGTNGNDIIFCNGDDADGVNTRQGTLDTVTIVSGTVLDTIVSRADQISVIVNGTGALDTTVAGKNTINMPQGGAVVFQGDMNSGRVGIHLDDDGSVDSTGDITANDGIAILLYGDGSVVSTGELVAAYNGIFVGGDGSIENTGDVTINSEGLKLGRYEYVDNFGLVLVGSGTITNTGDISVTYDSIAKSDLPLAGGIILLGGGTITNTGDIDVQYTGDDADELFGLSPSIGIILGGGGSITNTGDIRADLAGIIGIGGDMLGSILPSSILPTSSPHTPPPPEPADFTITNTGDISALLGMIVATDGHVEITNTGDIQGTGENFFFLNADLLAGYIVIGSTASITHTGDIHNALAGYIVMGMQSEIVHTGDIDAAFAGIVVMGDSTITHEGDITINPDVLNYADFMEYCLETSDLPTCEEAFELGGDLLLGYVSEIASGIAGISGSQQVDVSGSIHAPIAVTLGDGDDSLNIRPFTVINGIVHMGEGDDVVRIGNYAEVSETIYGGEGGEILGDLLIIGVGQVCAEDASSVADFGISLDSLNPAGDTVTYLGQTYTWAEFEALGREGFVAPCFGKINDGRINAYDLAAPDALYCTVENGVSIWAIGLDGQGTFSFAVSKAQIEAAFETAVSSGANQLIGSDGVGGELYALSDGVTLTFVSPDLREAGKQYLHSFDRTFCG